MSTDDILAHLFIVTLKGVTFEWFLKLVEGSIHSWSGLEKLFLTRFFEDVTKVTLPMLLATKQEGIELVKAVVERF